MARHSSVDIEVARTPGAVAQVAELFREYANSLEFTLEFQDFDQELRSLPGEYAEPGGTLLLATVAGNVAGCVGLRPLARYSCEMKRLYVRPPFRRHGVGRALARAVVGAAGSRGYRWMRLDTVPGMTSAISLYRSLGFVEIAPYRYNPVPGALFFELDLHPANEPVRRPNPPS